MGCQIGSFNYDGRLISMAKQVNIAPWWERLAARLFGERFEHRDGKAIVAGWQWRDRFYLGRAVIE